MKKLILLVSSFFVLLFVSGTSSASVEVTLHGPQKYHRTTGSPNIYVNEFPGVEGTATVTITNGDANGRNRVSSVLISINGQQIAGPSDFNQQVGFIELFVNLVDTNSLRVELRSGPGSLLSIKVTQMIAAEAAALIGPAGGTVEVTNSDSSLEGVKLSIPTGAMDRSTVISIGHPSRIPPLPAGSAGNNPIELKPSGLSLSLPALLTVPSHETSERNFYTFDEQLAEWFVLGTILDQSSNTFQVTIHHFSIFTWICFVADSKDCRIFPTGATVTYFIDANTNNADGSLEERVAAIKKAIQTWDTALGCRLSFQETTNLDSADIKFFWSRNPLLFLPPANVFGFPIIEELGLTSMGFRGGMSIRFNDTGRVRWTPFFDPTKINIEAVALHEIGHAIGLIHKCGLRGDCIICLFDEPIMATKYDQTAPCLSLSQDDKNRALQLYGASPCCLTIDGEGLGSGTSLPGWSMVTPGDPVTSVTVTTSPATVHSGNGAVRIHGDFQVGKALDSPCRGIVTVDYWHFPQLGGATNSGLKLYGAQFPNSEFLTVFKNDQDRWFVSGVGSVGNYNGQYTHITITVNTNTGEFDVSINGLQVATKVVVSNLGAISQGIANISTWSGRGGGGTDSYIDDLSIRSR